MFVLFFWFALFCVGFFLVGPFLFLDFLVVVEDGFVWCPGKCFPLVGVWFLVGFSLGLIGNSFVGWFGFWRGIGRLPLLCCPFRIGANFF